MYAKRMGKSTGDSAPLVADSGEVSFTKSSDHYYAMKYEARIRVSGSSTISATVNLGVPTPDAYGTCVVNLQSTYDTLAAGDYTVSILVTTPGGSTDSSESNAFTLPIA